MNLKINKKHKKGKKPGSVQEPDFFPRTWFFPQNLENFRFWQMQVGA